MIEKPISISEIYHTFKNSRDGQHLNLEKRYGRYIKKIDRCGLFPDGSEKILGADINNLKHLRLTLGLTQSLSRRLDLSEEERYHLDLATIIHDMPEARCKDTTHSKKNSKVEEKEFKYMIKIAQEVLFPDDKNKANLIINIYKNVVKDSTTKLGEIFNAVENLGYLRTGLNAYQHFIDKQYFRDPSYLWITHSTLSHGLPKLIKYSNKYQPLQEYLSNQNNLITASFIESKRGFVAYLMDRYASAREDVNKVESDFNRSFFKWQKFANTIRLKSQSSVS